MAAVSRSVKDSKSRLLRAATRQFAARGYAGTATAAVVGSARVNKRMLYHWFGSKQALYREVLAAQWQALAVALAGAESLDQALDRFFAHATAHPELMRLMMWEALQGGAVSRKLWASLRAPLFARAAAAVVGPHGLEPAQLVLSILGAVTFGFAFAPSLGDVLGHEPLSAQGLLDRRHHLQALLARLLAS